MEFTYFYIIKYSIVGILLLLAIIPFVKEYSRIGEITFKNKTLSYVLIGLFAVVSVFNPIKIDNSSKSDRVRASYDTQNTQEGVIALKPMQTYEAPSNEKEILSITGEHQ